MKKNLPFTIIPDSKRYTVDVKVAAVDPPPLGWPAADTIDFFKGVRQSVPWPDAFHNEYWRAIEIVNVLPGVRQDVSLDGKWESALTTVPTAPPVPAPGDLKWEPRNVPAWIGLGSVKPDTHAMYLRRKFTLREDEGKLHLAFAGQEGCE